MYSGELFKFSVSDFACIHTHGCLSNLHCETNIYLDCGVVLGLLGQLGVPVELVPGDIELDAVVAEHLLLVPHPHAVLELKVVRLQELEVDIDTLLGGPLIQLTGGSHSDLPGR